MVSGSVPSALLLSLLFGVEAGPPPPLQGGAPRMGAELDVAAGAFGGGRGALPSRRLTPKEQWLQWNWKLGNLLGDKEWGAWQKSREKPSAVELKLVDDAITKHKEYVAQRESAATVGQEFRRTMLAAKERAQLRAKQEVESVEIFSRAAGAVIKVKLIPPTINLEKLQQQKREQDVLDAVRRERMAIAQKIEDEKALQMKIKMAKLRAKRRAK